jgi:AP-1-like factor
MRFSPTDFYSSVTGDHRERKPTHRIVVSEETGERLLDAGATWDMIQNHKLFKQGLVDIGDVCERLKGHVQCDGQGPVFEEGRIRKAIEESVAGGNDELI